MNRKALGRGLGALLSSDRTIDLGAEPSEIDLNSIVPGPMQPRTNFDEAALENLAESIKTHGIVQPLLVRRRGEGFELIAGERRWRAAKLAGLTRVPVLVKEVADQNLLEIALIENIQRKDLTPFEESEAMQGLAAKFGYTHEDLARRLGKSRTTITETLSLNGIPPEVRKVCRLAGMTNRSLLLQVARQGDAQKMLAMVEKVTSQGVTREQLRKEAEKPAVGRPKAFVFAFRPTTKAFSLRLQFNKRNASKDEVISALEEILRELRKSR